MSSVSADLLSSRDLVLLDLDGTLVDTLGDLYGALAQVCRTHGRRPPSKEQTRQVASQGIRAMLELSWGTLPDGSLLSLLRQEFLDFYSRHLVDQTKLMSGMAELLARWREEGRPWGIVTNKPAFLTTPLLQSLALPYPPTVVVSSTPGSPPKPDPSPVRQALERTGYPPGRALFVGDARQDIQAGQAAHVLSLVALWGYLSPSDPPVNWQADGLLKSPSDLTAWLRRRDTRPRAS